MRRVRSGLWLSGALVLVCAHCGKSDISFTPEADARFVSAVAGRYTARAEDGSDVFLRVCEDAAERACAATPTADGCSRECHVIRGQGRGAGESLAAGDGCSCGSPTAEWPARAELELAAGGSIVLLLLLRGTVSAVPEPGTPHGGPIALRAWDDDTAPSASLLGEVLGDGRLRLNFALTEGGAVQPAPDAGSEAGADAGNPDAAPVALPRRQKLAFTRIADATACAAPPSPP